MASRFVVGPVGSIPVGGVKVVSVGSRSIGVFNVAGAYYALKNTCPHNGAPLCRGEIVGTHVPARPGEYHYARRGEIIRCPWHGWEFDILTGESVFVPHALRVRTFDVTVESDAGEAVSSSGVAIETFEVGVERGWIVLHV